MTLPARLTSQSSQPQHSFTFVFLRRGIESVQLWSEQKLPRSKHCINENWAFYLTEFKVLLTQHLRMFVLKLGQKNTDWNKIRRCSKNMTLEIIVCTCLQIITRSINQLCSIISDFLLSNHRGMVLMLLAHPALSNITDHLTFLLPHSIHCWYCCEWSLEWGKVTSLYGFGQQKIWLELIKYFLGIVT